MPFYKLYLGQGDRFDKTRWQFIYQTAKKTTWTVSYCTCPIILSVLESIYCTGSTHFQAGRNGSKNAIFMSDGFQKSSWVFTPS